jgi:hypothetical protein
MKRQREADPAGRPAKVSRPTPKLAELGHLRDWVADEDRKGLYLGPRSPWTGLEPDEERLIGERLEDVVEALGSCMGDDGHTVAVVTALLAAFPFDLERVPREALLLANPRSPLARAVLMAYMELTAKNVIAPKRNDLFHFGELVDHGVVYFTATEKPFVAQALVTMAIASGGWGPFWDLWHKEPKRLHAGFVSRVHRLLGKDRLGRFDLERFARMYGGEATVAARVDLFPPPPRIHMSPALLRLRMAEPK